MQEKLIDFILWINEKFFFKREHPFNIEKNGILNLNYSDFEYKHTNDLLKMYESNPLTPLSGGTECFSSPDKGNGGVIFKNKKILDVGCGAGGKGVYLAEKYNNPLAPFSGGIKVFGIDINDNFLNQARDFARQKNVDKFVHFNKVSALDTGFEVDKFDIIIMSDVIEHIPETEKLFDEMWRILKPGGIILFDFAPYYHYFGHHLWDTIQIPWIHLFFSDKFLIKLYKKSVKNLVDGDARIKLRIGKNKNGEEVFDYLNKITRKDFEKVMRRFVKKNNIKDIKINYLILKNINFFGKLPFLREIFIKHIVGYIKK